MSNQPARASLADRVVYRASFITGMVSALPQFSDRAFRIAQPLVASMAAIAPNAAGFGDGYDLVADRACAHIAKPTFTRALITCFVRGSNDAAMS